MVLRQPILSRFRRHEGGGGAAEFALVLPLFTLLFTGAIDIGGMAWTKMQVSAAARAGAAYALVKGFNSSAITAAVNDATELAVTPTTPQQLYGCPDVATGIATAGVVVSTTCSSGATAGKYVIVGASASYTPVLPWPFIAAPVSLSSTATVRIP